MDNQAGRAALRDFLMEWRGRLRPEDASWYTFVETAHSIRVSPHMLDRLSAALRLSEDEKRQLFSLAIDEMPACPREAVDSAGSLGREYAELRIFTERSYSASNMQELADLTTDLLFDLARPEFAYFVEAENNVAATHHVFGERAKALGMGRCISAGVKGPQFDGAIGYFQGGCEPYSERERGVLGLIAEIVHLALSVRI